ncbi:reverse transcriptase domain-containing protein [Tanacetum coccineum]|uniref:Reverse transcriptase domain-containing protein n=1 Tax=Tanacetum coccineum TaxID=301880 RepID=A0ABQ5AW70_9ASTR
MSLVEALALMPKYAEMLKDILSNKEKLLELANTPLNENCSAVLLKKLPEKLRDLRKFLIPCDFSELEKCMALANLGASINLMPLSVWKKLMLPELVPTRMILELDNRSIAYPTGITEDVFIQVDKFTFPVDFVVVDYDVDPRDPLILGRPFLRTARALVDVHREELILKVGDEKLTFNVNSTSKYPYKHGKYGIPTVLPSSSSDPLSGSTTSHFDHSLPDYEAFCFDVDHQKEKSSGTTTSYFDHSLPDYEAFCFDVDHQKENNSGKFEDLIYYDPSIDPPPIAERSDYHHEEFFDELAHIISPPEYDHFYFDIEVDPAELTRILNENLSSESVNLNKIIENNESKFQTLTELPTSHELNFLCLLLCSTDSTLSKEFSKTGHLVSFPSGNEDKVFDPGILIINGIHYFARKFSRLPNDNFKINKRDIFSEISLKIKSLICFHPKDKEIRGGQASDSIPSDESKVHFEVLSVLWGNRLLILDSSLSLFSYHIRKWVPLANVDATSTMTWQVGPISDTWRWLSNASLLCQCAGAGSVRGSGFEPMIGWQVRGLGKRGNDWRF